MAGIFLRAGWGENKKGWWLFKGQKRKIPASSIETVEPVPALMLQSKEKLQKWRRLWNI